MKENVPSAQGASWCCVALVLSALQVGSECQRGKAARLSEPWELQHPVLGTLQSPGRPLPFDVIGIKDSFCVAKLGFQADSNRLGEGSAELSHGAGAEWGL